jgi:hypothetical protein
MALAVRDGLSQLHKPEFCTDCPGSGLRCVLDGDRGEDSFRLPLPAESALQ